MLQKFVDPNVLDFVGCSNVPDIWLVGYGLDDQQGNKRTKTKAFRIFHLAHRFHMSALMSIVTEKRGWPHLYACPKCAGVQKTDGDGLFDDPASLVEERKKLLQELD